MARQRNKYPREFKLELLRQIEDGEKTASELCRELGLSLQQVSAWRRQLAVKGDEAFPGQGQKRGAAADLAELRKENERLREENEILKKVHRGIPDRAVLQLDPHALDNRLPFTLRVREDGRVVLTQCPANRDHLNRYRTPQMEDGEG